MAAPLLTTKLFIPPVRAQRVQRARLLARLGVLLDASTRLALISAPAGFGKTSLLAEWIKQRGRPAAWVSLDAGDNSADLFFAYLAAAVERARPGALRETGAMLRAGAPPPPEAVRVMLVVELAALDPDDPLVIVLDDYQFIYSAEVRDATAFLLDHLLPGARLIIATRADPGLPLARLRASGQMVELRAADLRFTVQETGEFLRQSLEQAKTALTETALEETAAALASRTEGWAAGLQMAAVALQTSPQADLAAFVRNFSGSHRFVLDYLAEEVLARLPDETVQFLLHTSALDRFCAGLCAEILDDRQGALQEREARCQTVLEALERANLFLIPLDGERCWFRYHHLFADLLRARLNQAPGSSTALVLRRASLWFEKNGCQGEAIQYALASAAAEPQAEQKDLDYERAARLVEQHTVALLARGELHELQAWDRKLPPHLAQQRPWLAVYRAWLMNFAGRLSEVEPALQQAEESLARLPAAEQDLIKGHLAAVRCYQALFSPKPARVFELFEIVKAKLPEGNWSRGVAEWALGYILRATGSLEQAREVFAHLAAASAADPWRMAMAVTDLGVVLRMQGRLREAMEVFRSGLRFVEEHGARKNGYTGRLLTALATALYDRHELAEARVCLEEAVVLNEHWRNPNHLVYSYLNLARVAAAGGDFIEARRLLAAAERTVREMPVLSTLAQSLQGAVLGLELAQGSPPAPGGALEEQIQADLASPGEEGSPFDEVAENRRMLFSRVLLAQRRPTEALRLLDGLIRTARRGGRGMVLVEALAMQSLGNYLKSEPAAALASFEEAARLAAPEAALRPIADLDALVRGALEQLAAALRRRAPELQGFLDRLLQITEASQAAPEMLEGKEAGAPPATLQKPAALAESPVKKLELYEPLSEREREVLALLAEGLTNAQVAARLVISPGTVKAHTANIFRKLDAANRTQAVVIAREAGLIP